ncbi:hypothetical protein BDV06DRAFT_191076 [Aspergillus oleicola]
MWSSVWDSPIVIIGLIGGFIVHSMLHFAITINKPKVPGYEHTGIVTWTELNVDRCVELRNYIINESANAVDHEPLLVINAMEYWESESKGHTKLLPKRLSKPLFEFLSRVNIIRPDTQEQHMLPWSYGLSGPDS